MNQNKLWTVTGTFIATCYDTAVQHATTNHLHTPKEIALATIEIFCRTALEHSGEEYVSLAVLKEYKLLDNDSAVADFEVAELILQAARLQPAMYHGNDLADWFREALNFALNEKFTSFLEHHELTEDEKTKLVILQVLREMVIVNYQHLEIGPFEESKPTIAVYTQVDGNTIWNLDDQLDPIHGFIGYRDTGDFIGDFAVTSLPQTKYEG